MAKQHACKKKWSFLIDRGGTFTDIIAISPDGALQPAKLLSENPDHYQDAAIEGIRRAIGLPDGAEIPNGLIETVRIGTTVATNALLERKGTPTLLLTSEGQSDTLEIGTQARRDIFALNIDKPKMLYHVAKPLKERILKDGTIITPLDEAEAEEVLQYHYDRGLRSVAILFMHSYKYPANEKTVATIARRIGYTQVTPSHQASPLIKYIPRGDTAVIDAYLSPILHHYTKQISAALNAKQTGISLYFMTSNGALNKEQNFTGKDAILSGPAGGIVGAASTAKAAGHDKIICFDMGGTSTDVAHFAGSYDLSFETEIAGHRLQNPMLDIQTVAAGGGSILSYENGRLSVGPQSAGANPGPKCYRAGGPLTVTDANLMTGRIDPETFPHIFGPNQNLPLDRQATASAFRKLAGQIDPTLSPEQLAEGFLAIADQNMTAAIRKISVERGIDLEGYTLQCFGGAGGQHAAAIAENLGLENIFIHAHSGLLSAYGMGCAREAARERLMLNRPLQDLKRDDLEIMAQELAAKSRARLSAPENPSETKRTLYLSYQGTETSLPVRLDAIHLMKNSFEAAHQRQFGYLQQATPIIIERIEIETALEAGFTPPEEQPKTANDDILKSGQPRTTSIFHEGSWQDTTLYDETKTNTALPRGEAIFGPALIIEAGQTIFAPKGWQLIKNRLGNIEMKKRKDQSSGKAKTALSTLKPDPVQLELFNSLFMSIAGEMGEALRGAARSVNIKERLDFSCAVFDAKGALIANAPHMPVHLGSMDQAVRAIIKANPKGFQRSDAFMTNAPYKGGTHLPDITVIKPVFDQNMLIAFVAARGHHADIGGIAPGSMSPNATTVNQEGVMFENINLIANGEFREQEIHDLLTHHPYPARNPDANIADLKAQLAACAKGVAELEKAARHFGPKGLQAYMQFVQDQACEAISGLIQNICDNRLGGQFEGHFEVKNDHGHKIAVTITPDPHKKRLTIDFKGTSPQTNDNFNAPAPVTRAAVLYVLRTLANANIPMNAGCLAPIDLIIPERSLLSPISPAAVVAGNVETSQQITNCLYGAFGGLGLAQGTMNNLTFGDAKYQYYETICSGAPAGLGFNGAAAVHTHMTNSRLTDPEILEERYPVMLKEFTIRSGSGGKGQWCAGDGVSRTIKFLKPMELALLTSFRKTPVPGVKGGEPGQPGKNILTTAAGNKRYLPACTAQPVHAGDCITIITPTGGGYGKKNP